MSGFKCPHCGEDIDLFKSGGSWRASIQLNVPFLGKIPIDKNIVESSDNGKPFILENKNSDATKAFTEIVEKVIINLEKRFIMLPWERK